MPGLAQPVRQRAPPARRPGLRRAHRRGRRRRAARRPRAEPGRDRLPAHHRLVVPGPPADHAPTWSARTPGCGRCCGPTAARPTCPAGTPCSPRRSGVVTVVGGKLTTYRRMAEDAVDAAVARAGLAAGPSTTARLPLDRRRLRDRSSPGWPRRPRRRGWSGATASTPGLVLADARAVTGLDRRRPAGPRRRRRAGHAGRARLRGDPRGRSRRRRPARPAYPGRAGGRRPRGRRAGRAPGDRARGRRGSLNRLRAPPQGRCRVPYLVPMLEPRGADSSTSLEPVTDVSARVLIEARNALLQGRIADALELVESARHDPDLSDESRVELALTGLLVPAGPRRPARRRAVLARADLAGPRARTRGRPRLLRPRRVRRGPRPGRPGRVLLRERRRGARRREATTPGCPGAAGWPGSWPPAARSPPPPAWWRTSSPRRGSWTRRTPSPTPCARCPRSPRPTGAWSSSTRRSPCSPAAGAARLEAQIRTDLAGWLHAAAAGGVRPGRRPAPLRGEVRPAGGAHSPARPDPLAARAPRRGARRRARRSAVRAQRRRAPGRPARGAGQAQPRDRRRARA